MPDGSADAGTDAVAEPSCDSAACGVGGCCGDACCVVVPSNEEDFGAIETVDLVLTASPGVFDTVTDCTSTSGLGQCSPVSVASGEFCVCRMDELTIDDVSVVGRRGLVLLASRTVSIPGLLSVAAAGSTPGAGAAQLLAAPGNAGGSFGTAGGNNSVPPRGNETLIPLVGGMGGGGSSPGGGGGALQIAAGVSIDVQGSILAYGGGGSGGGIGSAGDGGGSGGGILLEAPSVTLRRYVAANGGGGGGGGSEYYAGGPGEDGVYEGHAPGGVGQEGSGCPLWGYTEGGDGGFGSYLSSAGGNGELGDVITGCLGGDSIVGAGGGGGGAGRIRINTNSSCDCASAMISPEASFGEVTWR